LALILVVDGDPLLSEVIQGHFQRQGHQVLLAHAAGEALGLAERCRPDAIVLNALMPQASAQEVYQRLKALSGLGQTAILCYQLSLQVEEAPEALDRYAPAQLWGALQLRELSAKTESLLRRHGPGREAVGSNHLLSGDVVLHAHNLTVETHGRVSRLTPTEFALLRYLMLHVDEACSSRRLLENVWGYPPGSGSTDVVRTHVMNLRNKIETNPAQPLLLRTVRNCGYMLCSSALDTRREEPSLEGESPAGGTLLRYVVTRPSSAPTRARSEPAAHKPV
jgi:DNA-binding response OmpR family regulator